MPLSPEAQKRIDELKQERKARNCVVTVNIVDMHDEVVHHSFHPHFTTNQAMEVMENFRREAWSKISSEPMPTINHKDIMEMFDLYQVKYLIAGAYAMANLGYSRNTFDIDMWVEKSNENAQKIYNALEDFGVPFEIKQDDFMHDNSLIQVGIAPGRIDIMTSIDGVKFEDAWENKVEFTYDKTKKSYSLSLQDLIINKSQTNREKDRLDLVQLQQLSKIIGLM
jgi:hypothetical protein